MYYKVFPLHIMKHKINLNKIFIGLSVGLTIISAAAGIELYAALFGMYMALLISFVFELLRLSALYSFTKFTGFYRGLSFLLYILIAFVCFSAAILNFSSSIIQKSDNLHIEIAKSKSNDIFLLKNEYSRRIDEQLKLVEKTKTQNESLLAKTPDSSILRGRVQSNQEKIDQLKEQRIEFFRSLSDNNSSQWISDQKAILGIKDIQDVYQSETTPIGKAASELYGIDEVKLQKFAGGLLTFSIELGTVLLAILGTNLKHSDEIEVTEEKEVLEKHKKKKLKVSNKEVVPVFFEEKVVPNNKRKREKSSLVESIGADV